jgi:cytoskeletal protein CcmA (bactofilin family)
MANAATTAVVGEDAHISGHFRGKDLAVLGQLEGEIELSGRLSIGRQGRVKAQVKAAVTEIEGEFDGDVRTGVLVLAETARARGTFQAQRLTVREGAVLEGAVNRGGGTSTASAETPAGASPAPGPVPAPTEASANAAPSADAPAAKGETGGQAP